MCWRWLPSVQQGLSFMVRDLPWGLAKLPLGLVYLAPQPVSPAHQLFCVTPGKVVCSGSSPISLLITLFLHLKDIVSLAPPNPGPLSCVSSHLLPWLRLWEASCLLIKHYIMNSAEHRPLPFLLMPVVPLPRVPHLVAGFPRKSSVGSSLGSEPG